MVLRSLLVALLSLDDVAHVEPALAALPLPAQAVLVEGVPAHEVDRREGKSVLAVRAVVGEEGLGRRLQLAELVAALLGLADVLADYLLVPVDVGVVLFQFLKEEAFDVLVLDVFALGENAQDGQGGQVGNFAEFVQDLGDEVLLAEFWLHEVLESVDPKIDLIIAMLLAELDDILITIAGDVEVEEVLAHA